MKLTYITHHAPIPSRKADPICVMKTCHALSKAGCEVELVIPDGQGDSLDELDLSVKSVWEFYRIEENFEITQLPARFLYRLGFLGRWLYKVLSVFHALKSNNIFYVRHVEIALLLGMLRKPILIVFHDASYLEKTLGFSSLMKIYKSNPHNLGFGTVTHAGAQLFNQLGVDPIDVVVLPNGVDLSEYYLTDKISRVKYSIPGDKTVVGYVGSLYPGRGIEEVIDAAASFPDIHFSIAGGSPRDIQRCLAYADRQAVKNIDFIGFVPQGEVPGILLASDILIMPYTTQTPTHSDMSPMKMFDYMAAGKPIVATDFPVIREILADKVNAVLVQPDSATALAEGIQWCLEHPDVAAQLGQQAKRDVEQYTWDKRAERILSFIKGKFA